jgi:alpha-amylase/alpha-mannosidase (GH57 family)
MASFNCIHCSGDRSSMVTSITSWISGILNQLDWSHRACQNVCWRKISTSRQAHSKPNEASLTHVPDLKGASQFSWNWQRMKNS